MAVKNYDKEKAEAFAGKVIDALNGGALSIMLSIGHRLGLFDVMADMAEPATSEEIAHRAGLDERYVREWLGAMVAGEYVEVEPAGPKYRLPPEHAAWLTRSAAPDNIAVFAQYIPLFGTVEDKIVERFIKGGGLHYSEYGRFHEVMAEDSGQTVVAALLDSILPLVPGLSKKLYGGIDVLDVGCGQGRALNLMARTYPLSRFRGYDMSEDAIAAARAEAEKLGLRNVLFEVVDAARMPDVEAFDLITAFDAIHDQAHPDWVLFGIYKALRPDGVFLMQDISASSRVHENVGHPIGPFLYAISVMHCMSVSLAQGGMGLGTMWGRHKAEEMLRETGFTGIEIRELPHDIQNCFYIVSK